MTHRTTHHDQQHHHRYQGCKEITPDGDGDDDLVSSVDITLPSSAWGSALEDEDEGDERARGVGVKPVETRHGDDDDDDDDPSCVMRVGAGMQGVAGEDEWAGYDDGGDDDGDGVLPSPTAGPRFGDRDGYGDGDGVFPSPPDGPSLPDGSVDGSVDDDGEGVFPSPPVGPQLCQPVAVYSDQLPWWLGRRPAGFDSVDDMWTPGLKQGGTC